MTKLIASMIILVAVPMAHGQFAVVCGNCAEEPTQLLNHAELITHIAKTVLILENAVQQSKTMGFGGHNLGFELQSISNVLAAGQALNQATQNLGQRWNQTWGTPPLLPITPGFAANFSKWSTTAQASLQAAMLAGQLSHTQQGSAVAVISQLEGFLNAIDARNKTLQGIWTGTLRTSASLEKMHDTILSGNSAQQNFMQYQLTLDMQKQAFEQAWFALPSVPRSNTGW